MSNVRIGAVALVCSLLVMPAFAADPVDITPRSQPQITLAVNEAKVFKFDETITRIEVPREGIVQAIPRSQTEVTLTGTASGRTPIFVFGEAGRRIYAGSVVVSLDEGHLIRIYRQPAAEEKEAAARGDGKTDHAEDYWCTDLRCGVRIPYNK